MRKRYTFATAFLATNFLGMICPVNSAEVSADRLINTDGEPHNWLMNHRTYDAQRYSPLDRINKANAKDLKLAYAVALGGMSANANLESTPLAEDGYLYVVDQWGVLYRIDGRSGELGRILWRMDPGQEKLPLANRGAALWGNFVITQRPRLMLSNMPRKHTTPIGQLCRLSRRPL
jgi:alcohol dehydrogenase (cytochrome c)